MNHVLKKHLPQFIIVIIVLLIAIILPASLKYNSNRANRLTQSDSDIFLKIHMIDESGKEYTAHAEYPLLSNDEKWNNALNDFVTTTIADFKKEVHENNQARLATATPSEKIENLVGDMTIHFQVGQINKDAISIVLFIDYYAGGANGSSTLKTFNYNPTTKQFLTLDDIKGQISLQEISDNVREDLKSRFPDESVADMIDSGTTPKVENFEEVTFDENNMTIYFPKYAVLPGVYGTQTVTLQRMLIQK